MDWKEIRVHGKEDRGLRAWALTVVPAVDAELWSRQSKTDKDTYGKLDMVEELQCSEHALGRSNSETDWGAIVSALCGLPSRPRRSPHPSRSS